MTVAVVSLPFLTTGSRRAAPIARMAACGGLMIAPNSSVPNMPRLVTVSVPPSSSSCRRLPALARSTRSRTAAASAEIDLSSTPVTTGVTSPRSVATATAMSTEENDRTASGVQITFMSGTSTCAWAAALISRSLTEIGTVPDSFTRWRSFSSLSTRTVPRR
jgi:hypothetical protein